MPMTWDSTADAKLFAAILQICGVKPTGEQLKQAAQIMGPECTAKAITHRLGKIRKAGGGEDGNEDEGEAGGAAKNKLKTNKNGKGKTTAAAADGEVEAKEPVCPPAPKKGKKRSRVGMVKVKQEGAGGDGDGDEDELGGVRKSRSIEVGEDIGEGMRADFGEEV